MPLSTFVHRLVVLAALVPTLAANEARSDAEFPDTAPGRHARDYFAAYNAGEDAMGAFWASHGSAEALAARPVEARLGVWREMRATHPKLAPIRVVAAGDDFAEVLAGSESGDRLRIRFLCEAAAPHGLVALRVEQDEAGDGGAGSPGPAGPPPTDDAIVAALAAECDSLSKAGEFSGAVLLEKNGRALYRKAFGFASRAGHVPNTTATRFNLGSINKIFTTVAIHQLAEAGKLGLDSTIDRYLADYPAENARRITVRQLLEHRSGVPDFFNPRYAKLDPSGVRTTADWYALVRDEPLEFDPGTREAYSNGGYALLGMIVERVSGDDYYAYVRRHVYEPAGMKHTDHYAKDETIEGRAIGYTREGEGAEERENTPGLPGRGSAAGGGYSTVEDLARFARALRAGRLLGPEGTRRFGTFAIAGGSPGVNALLEPAGPWTLVVLANQDPPAAERFAKTVGRMLQRAASPEGSGQTRLPRAGEKH